MATLAQARYGHGRTFGRVNGRLTDTGAAVMPPAAPQAPPATMGGTPFPTAPAPGPLAGYTGNSLTVNPASVGTTPQNIFDSPAYQFRFGEGQRMVQQGAAAKGSLLSGGTLKDLQDRGQASASQEYGNQWDRDYRMAALNSGISEGNAGRTQSGLQFLSSQGYGAAQGMGGYQDQAAQQQAGGTIGSQSAWNQGIGGAANTIGGYLAARRQRMQGAGGGTGAISRFGNEGTGIRDVTGTA